MGKYLKSDQFKNESAREVGVTLNPGYNGNITAHDAGKIGGNIVKKVFERFSTTTR